MKSLRRARARWAALCQTVGPAWEHAVLIFDTRLRIQLFDVDGRA